MKIKSVESSPKEVVRRKGFEAFHSLFYPGKFLPKVVINFFRRAI